MNQDSWFKSIGGSNIKAGNRTSTRVNFAEVNIRCRTPQVGAEVIPYRSYSYRTSIAPLERTTIYTKFVESFLYKAEQTNVILVINSTKTMIRSTAMLTCSLVSFEIFIPQTIKLIIEPIFHRIVKTNLWTVSYGP